VAMAKAKGRQLSADDKLRILDEARQPGATVAEVLRRYSRTARRSIAGSGKPGPRCAKHWVSGATAMPRTV